MITSLIGITIKPVYLIFSYYLVAKNKRNMFLRRQTLQWRLISNTERLCIYCTSTAQRSESRTSSSAVGNSALGTLRNSTIDRETLRPLQTFEFS